MPVKDRKVILVILSVVIPALAAVFIMSNYAMVEGYVKRHYAENMLFDCYMDSGIMEYIAFCCAFLALLALVLPLRRLLETPFSECPIFSLSPEGLIVIVILSVAFGTEVIPGSIVRFLSGTAAEDLAGFMGFSVRNGASIAGIAHGVLLFVLFLASWYVGLSLKVVRELGIRQYITKRSLIYRIFPFCKKQVKELYHSLEQIDVSKSAGRTILKIVLLNGTVLLLISCLWYRGISVTIVYSVVLYFGLKFYVSRMQQKYKILLDKIEEISAGNLNVEITEDLGIFNPFKEQLLQIQTGFRNAVESEVKSQKMKSELITNVSHDLKTPLTAIITYVDILKDETLTEEQRREYLDTLEKKSLRLKILIEDLFEVSKATSGAVTLNLMDVDLCNLIKQVRLEMSDKLDAAGLDVRMDFPEEKAIVRLDSQKTYRIYENLFSNIARYALPGTRVYVQGVVTEGRILVFFKNISAAEITMDASRLAERFVRGDSSRNTEGSGLGLAIVKSFVELQGGMFVIENDGDLFKAITSFPVNG